MNARRKRAYRSLLYYGMVDIRNRLSWARFWSPLRWFGFLKRWRSVKDAAILADALHNLGYFAMNDFVGFDEDLFWKYMEDVETVSHYRSEFEWELNREPNQWTGPIDTEK